jgi:branched-chain amino acid transport system permease protein
MNMRAPAFVVVVGAAMLPAVVHAPNLRASAANVMALLIAAVALNLVAGSGGIPSLGHGAFMGIGAYAFALLRARAGLGPFLALIVAIAIVAAAAVVVARAVAPLRAPFAAVTTWVVAWAVWLAFGAFASLTGGAAGAVIPPARVHMSVLGLSFTVGIIALYEIGLVAVLGLMAGARAALRRYGPAIRAQSDDPRAAAAAGIDVVRVRTWLFAISAVVAGAAGILVAQVAGVADPTTFRPLLSIELFLVVLLGGAGEMLGPIAGLLGLLVISAGSRGLGAAVGVSGDAVEPLVVAIVLVFVLLLGRRGLVSLVRARFPSDRIWSRRVPARIVPTQGGARLEARDIAVSFGGVRALDGVSFVAEPGRCHAIIGPNGSGKTTLLRVLAGGLKQERGDVYLDGSLLHPGGAHERASAGVVRTLQQLSVAPDLSAAEHVLSGMEPVRDVGLVRALVATPGARREAHDAETNGNGVLASVDLLARADARAGDLDSGERIMLQFARALASRPRVLLLDEPTAGLDVAGMRRVLVTLGRAKRAGMTIVLVAHDLWLVRAIADRVTVLDAGAVIAEGSVEEVSANPRVRAAYLGR